MKEYAWANVEVQTDAKYTEEEYEQYGNEKYTEGQNNGYNAGYSEGFNLGEASAWDYNKVTKSGKDMVSYTYSCGYIPRYIFIKGLGSDGNDFIHWSLDSGKSFRCATKLNSIFDTTNVFLVTANGINFPNWANNDVMYTVEFWTIK